MCELGHQGTTLNELESLSTVRNAMFIQPLPFADHLYAPFIHTIEKPARYIGGEWGQNLKHWNAVRTHFCLAFPDIFDIGMSHLGTRILYEKLNAPSDMLCERAFAPWYDMERALRERNLPIVSLENAKPLSAFDVVGISLQHELVFTNVLTLLDLGGISLRAASRRDDEPLVLGGGSIASHPEPVAPFFDAFVLGDGELKAVQVARSWTDGIEKGLDRHQRLRVIASLRGVYVPSLYTRHLDLNSKREVIDKPTSTEIPFPIERTAVQSLDRFPTAFPVGGPEAVFDRLSVEIARGCCQGCRFCQAGMISRPERERPQEDIVETIIESLSFSGQDEISLTSLSPADYRDIDVLVRNIANQPILKSAAINVSSLRAYGLADSTLDRLRRVRISNLTFAPEAGTQRMRDTINKNITENQLLVSVQRAIERGWERIKLYFMIGLPTETVDDIDGIVELVMRVRDVSKRASRGGARHVQVTASASTFVPKPHTPFQWAQMDGVSTVQAKQRRLAECIGGRKPGRKGESNRGGIRPNAVELKTHQSHASVLEGVFSRGDQRLADVVEDAWRAGARFDAWDGSCGAETLHSTRNERRSDRDCGSRRDQAQRDRWCVWVDAMERHGLRFDDYLCEMPTVSTLPWDHISMGVSKEFLQREWNKSLHAQTTPPCLRYAKSSTDNTNSTKLVCNQCGIECDLRPKPSSPNAMSETVADEQTGENRRLTSIRASTRIECLKAIDDAEDSVSEDVSQSNDRLDAVVADGVDQSDDAGCGASRADSATYRFSYRKLGRASLLGHLDLVREIPRIMRRAGMPLCYSHGFHPKATLSYGPALQLGVPSFEEYVDVAMTSSVDTTDALKRINEKCPSGITFATMSRLPLKAPSVASVVAESEMLLAVSQEAVASRGGSNWLLERIECLKRCAALPVTRRRGQNARQVDIRPLIIDMRLGDSDDAGRMVDAGIPGLWDAVRVRCRVGGEGSVRFDELALLLFECEGVLFRVVRLMLRGRMGQPVV